MSTSKATNRFIRIVYFDEETGALCQCKGNFWKTCPLRAANDLPCKESIISITPVDRSDEDSESLDKALLGFSDRIRDLSQKGFFK